jgi:hypothetical protein
LLGRAEQSSPNAALRRAEGAGLDCESADRAIINVSRCTSSSDTVREVEYQILQIFEPEFGNPVVGPARATGLARVGVRDDCGLNPKQRFAPPVQGHDTHTKRMRDFLSQFPLRRQIICLR